MSRRYVASFISDFYNPLLVADAPTIGTATGGNAQASVTFTAPSNVGGGAISSYTVVSSGGQSASGASSPIVVTGLTNGTAYTFTAVANNVYGPSANSSASNSVTPVASVWREAGTGATLTALKTNLLYAGLGNSTYKWANVAPLVQANTNPGTTTGLSIPSNYAIGNTYNSSTTNGMTTGPTKFNTSDGYGTTVFRTANGGSSVGVRLNTSWAGSPNPGIACFWFYIGAGGMHLIGNADCTSRYLIQNDNPTSSAWVWIVVDIFNNQVYWDGVYHGAGGGTYTDLNCAYYMGWSNSDSVDAFYHDYRVYQYDATNHTNMVNSLKTIPTTSYYSTS